MLVDEALPPKDTQAPADGIGWKPGSAHGGARLTCSMIRKTANWPRPAASRHGGTSGAVTALEQARQRAAKTAQRLAGETAAHQEKLDRRQASQQAKAAGSGGRQAAFPKPMDQAGVTSAEQHGEAVTPSCADSD